MSDPFEEIEAFKQQGLPVNPLPASEVRRRGDRMRRRNTLVATVGGVAAALVAVAVPVAVAGGQGDRDVQPAPPVVQWRQEVPDGFPLGDGLQQQLLVEEVAPAVPEACGTPFWTTEGTADVAGAIVSGGEAFDARTLMVYADAEAAEDAVAGIRAAVADCPEQSVPDEGPDTTLVYDELAQDLATEESFVFVERARFDDGLLSDATITQVARSGNAVLLNQSHSSAGEEQAVRFNLRHQTERAAVPFAAMCVFAAQPCDWEGTPEPEQEANPEDETLPDGFDLLAGYPTTSEGDGFGPKGPSRDLAAIVPEACGSRAEAPTSPVLVDLLRAGWSAPEDYRERQLMRFVDEHEAEQYLRSVLAVFDECLDVTDGDQRRLTQVVTDVSGIADSVGGAITRYETAGSPQPGLDTLLVVRVGSMVLLATSQTEGGAGPNPAAAVQEAFNELLDESGAVIEEMKGLD